jgi:tetratricopeptide (TPR) repeat protein
MGLLSSVKAALTLPAMLKEAFRLGESAQLADQKAAATRYKAITEQYPGCYVAWYNLGILQAKIGRWKEALAAFSKALEAPKLRTAAAYGMLRLRSFTDVGDGAFPEEFRGENIEALGVQGPCHNAANALRNRGYACSVHPSGLSGCRLSVKADRAKYTILLYDVAGVLIKNVFREEKGRSYNLLEEVYITKLDAEMLNLNIGRLGFVQSPVTLSG